MENAELEERQLLKDIEKYELANRDINHDISNQDRMIQDLMDQVNEYFLEIEKIEYDLKTDQV